jgi:tetratricopeptide (TPR) repeat protein
VTRKSRSTRRRRAQSRAIDEPALPSGVDVGVLDDALRRDLLSALPGERAEQATRHLAATAALLDVDSAAAYEHARFVRGLTGRVAGVREATGLAAYRAGHYAEALAELRAWRRMTGGADHLPVMADCERGLGRPERALTLGTEPGAGCLAPQARAELAIVVAGARRDLDDPRAAVAVLGPLTEIGSVHPWTVRVWYAYADALLALGQRAQAGEWFAAAAALDEDAETDATDRAADLAEPSG